MKTADLEAEIVTTEADLQQAEHAARHATGSDLAAIGGRIVGAQTKLRALLGERAKQQDQAAQRKAQDEERRRQSERAAEVAGLEAQQAAMGQRWQQWNADMLAVIAEWERLSTERKAMQADADKLRRDCLTADVTYSDGAWSHLDPAIADVRKHDGLQWR